MHRLDIGFFKKLEKKYHYYEHENNIKFYLKRIRTQEEQKELDILIIAAKKQLEELNQNKIDIDRRYGIAIKKNKTKDDEQAIKILREQKKEVFKIIHKFNLLIAKAENKSIAKYHSTYEHKNASEEKKLISTYKKVDNKNILNRFNKNNNKKRITADFDIIQVMNVAQTQVSSSFTEDSLRKLKNLGQEKSDENDLILLNEAIKWVEEPIQAYKVKHPHSTPQLTIEDFDVFDKKFQQYIIWYCKSKKYDLTLQSTLKTHIPPPTISKADEENIKKLHTKNTGAIYHPKPADASADSAIASLYEKKIGNTVEFFIGGYNDNTQTDGAFNKIFNAMDDAKESILINGWTLSRDHLFTYHEGKRRTTLPALLAKKLLEMDGPHVVLMIWDNIVPDFSQDTKDFESVVIAEIEKITKNPQQIKMATSKLHVRFTGTDLTYSDHGKMIITDSQTLFMGGLDVTKVRTDFLRWQDAHCKIEGPVVKDCIDLFYRRFKREEELDPMHASGVEALEKVKEKGELIAKTALDHYNQNKTSQTNVSEPTMQFLTSVRKEYLYALGGKFNKFPWVKDTHTKELMNSQIQAIHAANDFIYMENQFFVGPRYKKAHVEKIGHNLVILEIFKKIKEKIKNNEPFHFYCQLPHRPEGDERDPFVQLILRKQWKTMEWLIKKIQAEIDDKYGDEDHIAKPTVGDYVTFSNLGFKNQKNEFEMKYTHSKLMIIDDKVSFIGSNNCNERSNKGNRDYEICMRIENDPAIKPHRQALMRHHFSNKVMKKIENLNPNHQRFYTAIKESLNENLAKFNSVPQETVYSTPWGNIETHQLEKATRPRHVLKGTNIAITMAGQLYKGIHKLHK